MKKRIEKCLPDAIKIISKVEIKDGDKTFKIANSNNEVDNKFSGYFSAFGASIVLSGMKPALAFYSNVKTVKERALILSAVYALINKTNENEIKNIKPIDLLLFYIENENDKLLKQKILDAAIALKLAVRTYKLI